MKELTSDDFRRALAPLRERARSIGNRFGVRPDANNVVYLIPTSDELDGHAYHIWLDVEPKDATSQYLTLEVWSEDDPVYGTKGRVAVPKQDKDSMIFDFLAWLNGWRLSAPWNDELSRYVDEYQWSEVVRSLVSHYSDSVSAS